MPASRTRIVVPVLLLLAVAAVVTALLLGGGGDGDAVPGPAARTSEGDTASTAGPAPEGTTDPARPSAQPTDGAAGQTPPAAADAPDLARRVEGDPMAAGPVDAPVSLIVYSDFGCPYCQRWAHDTQPTIFEYVEQGAVRLEWRDVNILGEDSTRAAQAAAAAAQQDAFWEYHAALFADMDARSAEQLVALASEVGLDVDEFTEDVADPSVHALVQANVQEARSLGLQSTPSFIVDGTPVVGAQPTEVFVELIETALVSD